MNYTLKTRIVKYPGQTLDHPNDAREANDVRNSLMKGVYGRLFDFLIDKINTSLSNSQDNNDLLQISILDMLGLENHSSNTLEQLCTNYTAEKLQMFTNQFFAQELIA